MRDAERFERYLQYHMNDKLPFIAYRHDLGFGFLKTVRPNGEPVSQRTQRAFYNKLIKLRKARFAPVAPIEYFEFDGHNLTREEI